MSHVTVIDHPLVQHRLLALREKRTGHQEFSRLLHDMTLLLTYEVTRDLKTSDETVETPVGVARGKRVRGEDLVVVAILRAGLGMVQALSRLVPGARVGHLGIFRDEETLQPVQYYTRVPGGLGQALVVIVDPMLATGGSLVAACDSLKASGAKDIRALTIISAPEGIELMRKYHPDVPIFTASIDERLNEKGYIIPGLGDAGDRLFGTQPGDLP